MKDRNILKPDAAGAKPGVKKAYLLKRLWGYLKRYKGLLTIAFILSIAGNALALIGPLLSGYAVDAIGLGAGCVDFSTVFKFAWLMLICYAVSAVMSYLLSFVMIRLSRKVVNRIRKDIFEKLVTLPVSFFDRRQTGDVISVISYDVDTVNTSLSSDLVQVFASIFTVIGSFIMMLAISPQLVLVFVVTVPVSILITRFINKKVRPLFRERSKKLGQLNGFIEEMTGGKKTASAYNREEVFIDRFEVKNKEAMDAYFKAEYYASTTGPSMNFINNLSLALISIFGALFYMAGSLTLGSISSFVLYSRKFSGPINEFASIISEFQSAFAAAERIFKLIDEPAEPADAIGASELAGISGRVEIKDLSFGYEPGKVILNDFNLNAEKGSIIAIVGPTGAGKTTIINLLMRFYDAGKGTISIDGKDIAKVTRKSLRSAFTMVLQDTWLFYGTIFENIAYGKENVTREEVIEAAKAAKIHSFISALPDGYDTILTDNAANISKGQKQLMTIARAMLIQSKMLILDEATSYVDTMTEREIQDAMLELMRGRTCFVIAHRLSTIEHADNILVIREGNVVEQGTHTELMGRKGFYYDLYHSQYTE